MGRVGCSRAHHMRSLRPTRQPPAHRVWMPPHCPRLRVDPAQPSSAIRLVPHARVVWTGCGRAGKVQAGAPTAQVVERPGGVMLTWTLRYTDGRFTAPAKNLYSMYYMYPVPTGNAFILSPTCTITKTSYIHHFYPREVSIIHQKQWIVDEAART
jgi:hypothetical protein